MMRIATGKSRLVHRVAYALAHSRDIDEVSELDHRCRVRNCAEPDHLEEVAHRENVKRGDLHLVSGAKTHCPQGHPYDEANTYTNPAGRRICRICARNASRRYEESHPERAKRPWSRGR